MRSLTSLFLLNCRKRDYTITMHKNTTPIGGYFKICSLEKVNAHSGVAFSLTSGGSAFSLTD